MFSPFSVFDMTLQLSPLLWSHLNYLSTSFLTQSCVISTSLPSLVCLTLEPLNDTPLHLCCHPAERLIFPALLSPSPYFMWCLILFSSSNFITKTFLSQRGAEISAGFRQVEQTHYGRIIVELQKKEEKEMALNLITPLLLIAVWRGFFCSILMLHVCLWQREKNRMRKHAKICLIWQGKLWNKDDCPIYQAPNKERCFTV